MASTVDAIVQEIVNRIETYEAEIEDSEFTQDDAQPKVEELEDLLDFIKTKFY